MTNGTKLKLLVLKIAPLIEKKYPGLNYKELTRDEFYSICREAGCLDDKGRWILNG